MVTRRPVIVAALVVVVNATACAIIADLGPEPVARTDSGSIDNEGGGATREVDSSDSPRTNLADGGDLPDRWHDSSSDASALDEAPVGSDGSPLSDGSVDGPEPPSHGAFNEDDRFGDSTVPMVEPCGTPCADSHGDEARAVPGDATIDASLVPDGRHDVSDATGDDVSVMSKPDGDDNPADAMADRHHEPADAMADTLQEPADAAHDDTPPAPEGGDTADICPAGMVLIPAKRFTVGAADLLGASLAPHPVDFDAYCMDVTEVTRASYGNCVKAGACTASSSIATWPGISDESRAWWDQFCMSPSAADADHPVTCVSWQQAGDYCAFRGARLPTEEEWEYAARGPLGWKYTWGNDPPPQGTLLNACGPECVTFLTGLGDPSSTYAMYSLDDGWTTTAPVRSYPSGAFGLWDMAGNVWEWTSSHFCTVGTSGCASDSRTIRGGSWDWFIVDSARAAYRTSSGESTQLGNIGFRCAR